MAVTLKDFIEQAIVGIVEGLDGAKKRLAETGHSALSVSPPIVPYQPEKQTDMVAVYAEETDADGVPIRQVATLVRFDVAVHAGTTASGGGRLEVAALGLLKAGGKGEVSSEDKSVSRIQFVLPLVTSPVHPSVLRLRQTPRPRRAVSDDDD